MKKPPEQLQENHICTFKHLGFCGNCKRSNVKKPVQVARELSTPPPRQISNNFMTLEQAINEAIARQLVVGREYQTEYGVQKEEAALTPIIRRYFQDNQTEILKAVIDIIGREEVIKRVTDGIVAHLEQDKWNNYNWREFIKETSPLVADKVAKQMYESHKREICDTPTTPPNQ